MATFRARARALDMLGRQQIANIPTAISELFKNAHDAYAGAVEADYFRADRLFVLRDDGVGMTEQEFAQRWLTLGTESKLAIPGSEPPYAPPGAHRRPLMGEKGVGRLAIASLGSQALVLTRAKRGKQVHGVVAAFIPWRLFTIPGIDLEQVDLPVRMFSGDSLPSKQDIAELVTSARKTLRNVQRFADPDTLQLLDAEMSAFESAVDPKRLDGFFRKRFTDSPSLADGGTGTHFFVLPTEPTLSIDLEGGAVKTGTKTTPPMIKMLIGFTNALSPDAPSPVMKTAFRDHRSADSFADVASEKDFFSLEDLKNADHFVSGHFDEHGGFHGSVRVFDKTMKYSLPSLKPDEPFLCGPFELTFGYLQGEARASLLYKKDPEGFVELGNRLDSIGGLYVYRDGIRILPYGDTDFDFLKVEERRSKGAAYYFFSYRRMFGEISLTRAANSDLQEKTGREGFRRNKAYQQFIDSLTNLLVQLAAEFFREGGERADFFQKRKEELDKGERLRRERDKSTRDALAQLSDRLESALRRLDRGEAKRDVRSALRELSASLTEAKKAPDPDTAARSIEAAEKQAIARLDGIRAELVVEKPRATALTPAIKRDWAGYLELVQAFDAEELSPTREKIEVATADAFREVRGTGQRLKRARASMTSAIDHARGLVGSSEADLSSAEQKLHGRIQEFVRDSVGELENAIAKAVTSVSALDPQQLSDAEFARRRLKLEDSLRAIAERRVGALRRIRDLLAGISSSVGTDLPAPDDMTEALEEELLALRDRAESDLQLTQLGMAIDIINHEFSASIRTVRGAIKKLKVWSDRNPSLASVYQELRTSFDHLDAYLRLFTPLHRRLYRSAVEIKGNEIARYIGDLFRERLRRHDVEVRATDSFKAFSFTGYPSTFYPVFVNLVDNAIFWLSDRKGERFIELDATRDAMLVCDNGPGIPERDREAVFEMGFTRKPGGRGLGLYISREILRKAGYSLELIDPRHGRGATFEIRPRKAE